MAKMFVPNYEGATPTPDRRSRDRKPFDPKRREDDNRIKHNYVSQREEHLLKLIDAHIFRLTIKREREGANAVL